MSKEIPLTQGKFAIVDDEDYEYLMQWKWTYDSGYARRQQTIDGKRQKIRMHNQIMNPEDGLVVDHIDGDGINNTKSNLRKCSRQENAKNRTKQKDTSSSYKGVSWCSRYEKWIVSIKNNKKTTRIGYFTNEIAGANAYNYYAKLYHGEFAKLNEVEYMEDWENYKCKKNKTSIYTGVSFHKHSNLWKCQFLYKGKHYFIGYFKEETDAAIEYNKKILEVIGEDAKLNIIEGCD